MKIDFEVETEYGLYRDALYFPDNEPLPDDATIEAMKAERAQNWVEFMKNPPPPGNYPEAPAVYFDENGNLVEKPSTP